MIEQLPSLNDVHAAARFDHLAGDSVREAAERITDSIAADIL